MSYLLAGPVSDDDLHDDNQPEPASMFSDPEGEGEGEGDVESDADAETTAPRNVNHLVATELSLEHRKLLNLARDWLSSFVPHSLQKIDRVTFGLLSYEDLARAKRDDP